MNFSLGDLVALSIWSLFCRASSFHSSKRGQGRMSVDDMKYSVVHITTIPDTSEHVRWDEGTKEIFCGIPGAIDLVAKLYHWDNITC